MQRFFLPETPEEHQYVFDRDHGTRTTFNPSLTAESLVGYGPAVAASNATAQGETVLENLRVLAGGAPFAPQPWGLPRHSVEKIYYSREGMRFFSDVAEKEHVAAWAAGEEGGKFVEEKQAEKKYRKRAVPDVTALKSAEEAVREAIVARAIVGEHEKPAFAPAGDAVAAARNWHLREGTYGPKDLESFEAKLKTLVGARKGSKAAVASIYKIIQESYSRHGYMSLLAVSYKSNHTLRSGRENKHRK
ncbi:hypothetical protein ACRALDRAFT_208509 [Sodiomyces alcalophilus JCM 7366]|uniref:uncharacterized protein n=1 Tax=Sodiomyces alcalophilus JCM 7366 TaxID=591952 RepID=UPI0039B5B0E7